MEHTGTIPPAGIRVDDLRPLFEVSGGVASVYLDTPAAVDRAAQRDLTRWQNARRSLEADGAPPAALDAIEALVPDAHRAGGSLAAFAGAGGLLLSAHDRRPARHEVARWDELPSVAPLIAWRQEWPAHLVVVADHIGADIYAGRAMWEAGGQQGGNRPIAQNRSGGWSQRRHQDRVRDTWEHNAGDVVERVVELAGLVEPEIVLLGGDPRAVGMIRAGLPRPLQELLEEIDATRAADGSDDQGPHEVTTMLATAAARDTVAVLEELRQQLGREDRAVEGAAGTLAALREARVEMLLVHDDVDDDRPAWFGDEMSLAAMDAAELDGVGAGDARRGRLVDVAIRAAVGTGASVRVVPRHGGPAEGLGALLRWGG